MDYRFVRPLDVLYLRGNRLFGEAGEHAEAVMPPWPSLIAGALRSRILVDRGVDLARFAQGARIDDPTAARVLGTPDEPGSFRVGVVAVARRHGEVVEVLAPPPADLFIPEDAETPVPQYLEPVETADLDTLVWPRRLRRVPVLRTPKPAKPTGRWWLTSSGLRDYLRGKPLASTALVERRTLWETDARLGIALRPGTRTVETGRLYTSDAVAFHPDTGFLVGVAGAAGLLPYGGLLRLGGDGRGAAIEPVVVREPWTRLPTGDRFRVVLSTPGLFPSGWCPLPLDADTDPLLRLPRFEARLVAAAVPRAQVVSGWDLARDRPKPAQRVVPAGAVYWFERLSGDVEALSTLLQDGLWPVLEASGQLDALDAEMRRLYEQRRAEGFNNVWLGDWASNT
ncbi:MAG: type III-B CRISPR module-associated Cmr3 family protein [Armatimonadota bacterium]|nr:type III-B CRISPR module-associated Cmr3 family protein [Armatimonadota bacterium]